MGPLWLPSFIGIVVIQIGSSEPMAFMRSATSCSFKSRAWSTAELGDGLAHLLTDGRLELPDDEAQLEDSSFLSLLPRCEFCMGNPFILDTL
jgi:hypothetical protein